MPIATTNVYFDIGSAVSALGVTWVIQQLLKPIYVFRLEAYNIRLSYITWSLLATFVLVCIAAFLSAFHPQTGNPLYTPICWEIAGGVVFALTYTLITLCMFSPVRLYTWNLKFFLSATAKLLAEAADEDRARYAEDLLKNIEKLFTYAIEWEKAIVHTEQEEWEKRHKNGQSGPLPRPLELCPFYCFTHAKAIQNAEFSNALFQLICSP